MVIEIHGTNLGISSGVESCNVLVEGSWGDIWSSSFEDISDALVIAGLNMLIEIENSIDLWVVWSIAGVVRVGENINDIFGIIQSSEGVIWEGTHTDVDSHGSICRIDRA